MSNSSLNAKVRPLSSTSPIYDVIAGHENIYVKNSSQTRGRAVIEGHCVRLVKKHRLISNMTYLGQVMYQIRLFDLT